MSDVKKQTKKITDILDTFKEHSVLSSRELGILNWVLHKGKVKVINLLLEQMDENAEYSKLIYSSPAIDQTILKEWSLMLQVIYTHFCDKDRTILWFSTPNHLLGGVLPQDMIRAGKFKKLYNFIITSLDENEIVKEESLK